MVTQRIDIAHRPARVLVIEPELLLKALTCSTLETGGHVVVGVDDVTQVFGAIAHGEFDAILIDVECTGDLLEELARTPKAAETPIVAVGGTDLIRLARAGVLEHVRKPYGYAELNDAVNAVLAMEDIAFERDRIRALADGLVAA
jgi:DNA-binding response OmpR family regulator